MSLETSGKLWNVTQDPYYPAHGVLNGSIAFMSIFLHKLTSTCTVVWSFALLLGGLSAAPLYLVSSRTRALMCVPFRVAKYTALTW